jgi:hypothetical protein
MASRPGAGRPGIDTADAVKSLRQNAASFWRQYGNRFETWWSSLDCSARRSFILEYTICMPEVSTVAITSHLHSRHRRAGAALRNLPIHSSKAQPVCCT